MDDSLEERNTSEAKGIRFGGRRVLVVGVTRTVGFPGAIVRTVYGTTVGGVQPNRENGATKRLFRRDTARLRCQRDVETKSE